LLENYNKVINNDFLKKLLYLRIAFIKECGSVKHLILFGYDFALTKTSH